MLKARTLSGSAGNRAGRTAARPLQRHGTCAGASPGSAQRPLMQDAAAHPAAARQAVDPAHRRAASARAAVLERLDEAVDVVDALALLPDPGRRDAQQHALDLEHVSGETHAAERGAEQIGLVGRASTRRRGRPRRAGAGAARGRRSSRARWWFLPCTSAATMPPSVMNWVPGRDRQVEAARQKQPVERLTA